MILITGVSGYIGCHLATFFERKKINYIGLDNLKYSYKSNVPNKKKFYNIDISNIKRVDSLFKNFNINTVIHAAASAYVMEGEKKKNFYIKNNIINTIKFIDICKKNKIKNFIFLSSSNVYKEKKSNTAFHENDKIEPKNIYGKTKAVIEKYLITKNFGKIYIRQLFLC